MKTKTRAFCDVDSCSTCRAECTIAERRRLYGSCKVGKCVGKWAAEKCAVQYSSAAGTVEGFHRHIRFQGPSTFVLISTLSRSFESTFYLAVNACNI